MKLIAKLSSLVGVGIIAGGIMFAPVNAQEDSREFVKLPEMMQKHMLASMRDHLRALEEILDNLADGKTEEAGKIAEKRLGMSSLGPHGAAHLAKFIPKEMGKLGTQMHKAASRFVIAAQNAEFEPSAKAQHKVYRALQQVMENCNACHSSYRIR